MNKSATTAKAPKQLFALAWATGRITFSIKEQSGAITIASGPAAKLRRIVNAIARHAYTPGVILCPGVPEADTDEDKFAAIERFQEQIKIRL